ncbi:MAG: hypothetical protein AAFU77_13830 [Myxococcota bacterium]
MSVFAASLLLAAMGEQTLAILPLEPQRIEPQAARILDQIVLGAASDSWNQGNVIGMADIEAMIGFEDTKEVLDCDQVVCAAEIGGALGASHLLTGQVAALGTEFIVSLSLIDVQRSRVESREVVTTDNEEGRYRGAIFQAVESVLDGGSSAEVSATLDEPTGSYAPHAGAFDMSLSLNGYFLVDENAANLFFLSRVAGLGAGDVRLGAGLEHWSDGLRREYNVGARLEWARALLPNVLDPVSTALVVGGGVHTGIYSSGSEGRFLTLTGRALMAIEIAFEDYALLRVGGGTRISIIEEFRDEFYGSLTPYFSTGLAVPLERLLYL